MNATPQVVCILLSGWLGLTTIFTTAAYCDHPDWPEAERKRLDDLIAKVDSVKLRKLSPRLFKFAEWLVKEKRDGEARRYFEKALEGDPWALQQQLLLGEFLMRAGQPDALREREGIVLRVGEDDEVLICASQLIARPLPRVPVRLAGFEKNRRRVGLDASGTGKFTHSGRTRRETLQTPWDRGCNCVG